MDYWTILLACLVASGSIMLAEALYFKPRRVSGMDDQPPAFVSYASSFFPLILVVLLVRSFVFEPFRIPSPSMMPNLVNGDFVFVTKFAYGLRLPLLNTKILATGEPHRGDVVVFRLPADPSTTYIKRLIGLPGDHIHVEGNRLTINGSTIPLVTDGTYEGGDGFDGSVLGAERFGRTDHQVMFAAGLPWTDFDAVVPAGQYFFMGDNRNDSQDSRFPQVGFVPEKNLVGRAVLIWMNWPFPRWPHWDRIGTRIR
jgi:signal peptidase I